MCDIPCQMQLAVESLQLASMVRAKDVAADVEVRHRRCELTWSNWSCFAAQEMSVEAALNGHVVPEVSIEG